MSKKFQGLRRTKNPSKNFDGLDVRKIRAVKNQGVRPDLLFSFDYRCGDNARPRVSLCVVNDCSFKGFRCFSSCHRHYASNYSASIVHKFEFVSVHFYILLMWLDWSRSARAYAHASFALSVCSRFLSMSLMNFSISPFVSNSRVLSQKNSSSVQVKYHLSQ